MEFMYPNPLAQVLQQPDFLLDDVDDLLRYKEGELLGFFTTPCRRSRTDCKLGDQEGYGPTQVKGGPGTGEKCRSTVPRALAIENAHGR